MYKYTSLENKKRIAKDYHLTSASNLDIANKYGVSPKSVPQIAFMFNSSTLKAPVNQLLLKIDEDDIEKAIRVLRSYDILSEKVAKEYQLYEFYESSINN